MKGSLLPQDIRLLPQTYRWPKRLACWVWWKSYPLRWLTRPLMALLRIQNPYCRVVAVCALVPESPALRARKVLPPTDPA